MASSEYEDSACSSTSEAEMDSDREQDHDEDDENDPDKLLGAWLGELENLNRALEVSSSSNRLCSSSKLTIPAPRMDTYRFSMANMEDSQDVELDAILGELCALENQFEKEMMPKSHSVNQSLCQQQQQQQNGCWKNNTKPPGSVTNNSHQQLQHNGQYGGGIRSNGLVVVAPELPSKEMRSVGGHTRSNSGGGLIRPNFELGNLQHQQVDSSMYSEDFLRSHQKTDFGLRTESPDNDSAFSDSVSMLSSESSASSGGHRGDVSSRSLSSQSSSMSLASSPTQAEQAARIKAEKIKIALEKMKEASIKKLFIKAFSADNSAKSLLIDERMTVGHVTKLLAEKNHVAMDIKWGLVEYIPELYMERVYEDHEHLVENLLLWTRDSCNQLLFLSRDDKYDLFNNPQDYLLGGTSSEKDLTLDSEAKATLVEEFFSSSGAGVPEVEGHLYLKSDGKKAWKKHFFVLRASGLYYCPKGKSKLSKDLLCLTTFEMNNVYFGLGWRKKYKAPTDFGFAVKHPQIQTKSSKYIKYLCAEDEISLHQWVTGIRIVKYGTQLRENYDTLLRDIEDEELDNLAHSRSFSISSVSKTSIHGSYNMSDTHSNLKDISPNDKNRLLSPTGSNDLYELPTTIERLCKGRIIHRQDSIRSSKSNKSNTSNSSGCPSERSSGTPTADQMVFEADFPMGTIKRKPSMTPKIPLTTTTRNIAKQSGEENTALDNASVSTIGSNGSGGSLCGSLGRTAVGRFTLRRSKTDDRISFGSLSRRISKQTLSGQSTPSSTLMKEELPLPPPPLEIDACLGCFNFDTLPPPPPEAFRSSTLSLESLPLPPPPPTDETLDFEHDSAIQSECVTPVTNSSSSSCSGSPLSPPADKKILPAIPPKPRRGVQRRQSENDALGRYSPRTAESVVVKPRPSKQKLNLDMTLNLNSENKTDALQHSTQEHHYASPVLVRSRRTSAPCTTPGQLQVHSAFSPTNPDAKSPRPPSSHRQSRSQHKPSPPKRSENTKLSSAFTAPQRRSASASAAPYDQSICPPPESFLRDLQKVMIKKWKVAQQLSEESASPHHPILGFRDPNELPKSHKKHSSSSITPPPIPNHAERSHYNHQHHHSKSHNKDRQHHQTKHSGKHKKQPPIPPPKKTDEACW